MVRNQAPTAWGRRIKYPRKDESYGNDTTSTQRMTWEIFQIFPGSAESKRMGPNSFWQWAERCRLDPAHTQPWASNFSHADAISDTCTILYMPLMLLQSYSRKRRVGVSASPCCPWTIGSLWSVTAWILEFPHLRRAPTLQNHNPLSSSTSLFK